MDWKREIALIENNSDWQAAIAYYNSNEITEQDIYIRLIFVLLDFVVDGQYTQENHDIAAPYINTLFVEGNSKFGENHEFLFFCGIMMGIGEWYFTSGHYLSAAMLKKASDFQPDNGLYKLIYMGSINSGDSTTMKHNLARGIMNDKGTMQWLEGKGMIGYYVGGMVESYERDK